MAKKKIDLEKKYELIQKEAHNESQIVWQYWQPFVLGNTIIIGFIAQNFSKSSPSANWLLAIIGLILSVLWWGTFERRWGWYKFRMAQLRSVEKEIDYKINGEDYGKKFSDGWIVDLDVGTYRLNWMARIFKTEFSTRVFVILFIVIYLYILFFSFCHF